MKKYDVIVVGAGPAGSMASRTLAKKGLRVLLIERKRIPGMPKQCAEGINKKAFEFLDMQVKKNWISNEYDSILVGLIKGGKALFRTPRTKGYVLDRKVFDYDLAMEAKAEGSRLLLDTAVNKLSVGDDEVSVVTSKGQFSSTLLIAADGPQSHIARQLGLGRLNSYFAFQYELEGRPNLHSTLQVFLDSPSGLDGYCWIFPKKNSMNIGIGSTVLSGLKDRLDEFIKIMDLSSRKILELNTGLIPGRNKLKKAFYDRILVIGDAAGHTNPLTGGGIPVALYDGVLAGEIAVEAIKAGKVNSKFLHKYQRQWDRSPFGKAWEDGFRLKNDLTKQANTEILKSLFSKVGFETITGRKGAVKKLIEKGFTFRESRMLFRIVTGIFDKVIDYAM
ncbi:MAG: hypothetical protein COS99_04860 [Candidatus Omnitrophica bacterium CG07_land_8_20_14_0_80_42_15]|uniref:Uncharacterized protein n=1 Tax=Candidatus Aquitaenariimonas noxiae TaxID=1974741 RepID=A0A2J0KUV0_9BACT|nr:MAG: hypothetical protein COS99_04860 [Candidatus Omnitrophica bacterium CG07_land_8_20_14_0_80_42_15]